MQQQKICPSCLNYGNSNLKLTGLEIFAEYPKLSALTAVTTHVLAVAVSTTESRLPEIKHPSLVVE
jgi:hypothetical protein